ncbi:hypothetical protein CERSUDRAFT_114861 [Gelatoporia subvermispora B]|uniref:Uncharacterized protein n=1 Tax=Ceriporiopsis subvermispora (strain B) TaxID=914234 RepID=M2PL01_CERS8|nr:hypothetical protein CERSUDRAFT_114861 [Gelatoporia subvermispora B]
MVLLPEGLQPSEQYIRADCADERVMAEDAVERYVRCQLPIRPRLTVFAKLVSLGKFMIDCVSGPHFTCIDFGLRNDRHKMIEQALRVIRRFEQKGVEPQQMIVTVRRRPWTLSDCAANLESARFRRLRRV